MKTNNESFDRKEDNITIEKSNGDKYVEEDANAIETDDALYDYMTGVNDAAERRYDEIVDEECTRNGISVADIRDKIDYPQFGDVSEDNARYYLEQKATAEDAGKDFAETIEGDIREAVTAAATGYKLLEATVEELKTQIDGTDFDDRSYNLGQCITADYIEEHETLEHAAKRIALGCLCCDDQYMNSEREQALAALERENQWKQMRARLRAKKGIKIRDCCEQEQGGS